MNNCPNCSSHVNAGEAFCRVCGTKIPVPQNNVVSNTQQPQQVNNIEMQNSQQVNNQVNVQTVTPNINNQGINSVNQTFQQPQNNIINNEDLIDSYIGKNADKLKNGNFSVNTFFFGTLYVLYRKMWLLSLILLAVSVVATLFLSTLASFITWVANIVISTQFKKLYLKHVEEQVDKIKAENPGKTKEQLMMICSQKGGTTLIPVIIAIIIYVFIFFIAFASVFSILNSAKENVEKQQEEYNNTTTNKTGLLEHLSINIPSMLKESSYSTDDYKSYRTDYSGNDSCSLTWTSTKANYYNNDAKQYLEKSIYYSATDTYSGISEKTLNNNNWYYASVTTSYSQKYYYSIVNDGTIYEIEFGITSDEDGTCSSAYNTVVSSLKFK